MILLAKRVDELGERQVRDGIVAELGWLVGLHP